MELEMTEILEALRAGLERLSAAASALESSVARLEQRAEPEAGTGDASMAATGDALKIRASVETGGGLNGPDMQAGAPWRDAELEQRLAQAELALASLQAGGARETRVSSPRKTLPAATVQLLAKQGIDSADTVDVQSLDAALAGLSVEQRIAVKSQMMRTGALTL